MRNSITTWASRYAWYKLVGLFAGLAMGCAGTPTIAPSDPESADNDVANVNTPVPPGTFVAAVESPDDPGYCGYTVVATDADGREFIEEERYYYDTMNDVLDRNPTLREQTGLAAVSSCDEARKFTKLHNAYQEPNPATDADIIATLSKLPVQAPEGAKRGLSSSGEVEKIYRGSTSQSKEVVNWFWQASRGTNKGKWQTCTAIRLAGTLFLTAAHCMSISKNRGANGKPLVDSFPLSRIRRLVNGSAKFYEGPNFTCDPYPPIGQNCEWLSVTAYMNPNYTGSNMSRGDLALIFVDPLSQPELRSSPDAVSDFDGTNDAWMLTKAPAIGEQIQLVAWGPSGKDTTPTDQKFANNWQQRVTEPLTITRVDTNPSFITSNQTFGGSAFDVKVTANNQPCMGDSGGAAYKDYFVYGVLNWLSATDPARTNCGAVGASARFERLDFQYWYFLQQAISTLQSWHLTKCSCGYFPDSNDPTNYFAPAAHVRCNVGCEDPSQLL